MNPSKHATVAIIEDDIALVQMYRTKFELEGYQVETAGDGVLGLALLEQFHPDVILLDLMMPNMGGVDMLAQYRKKFGDSKSKIIVLTNMGNDTVIKQVKELGAVDYIVKAEMTPKQVTEKVKAILAK